MTPQALTEVVRSAAVIVVAVAVAVLLVGCVATDDIPLTGEIRQQAIDAALAEVGPGEVTAAEVGNDGSAYEIEITTADGAELEVRIDESFAIVEVLEDD